MLFIRDVALFHVQEEVTRLASLQPQVELLEAQLKELREEKEGEEDPSAFLDADVVAFKEHYHKVLEDLRAREKHLHLGERGGTLIPLKNLVPCSTCICVGALDLSRMGAVG